VASPPAPLVAIVGADEARRGRAVVATPKLEGPGFDALGNPKGVKRQAMTCEHCFSEWTAVTPADAKPGLPVACPNCGGENTPRPGIEVVQ
jgi:hypothetical protein